jgi:hypothetical protein
MSAETGERPSRHRQYQLMRRGRGKQTSKVMVILGIFADKNRTLTNQLRCTGRLRVVAFCITALNTDCKQCYALAGLAK